jgi:hypothetical protein
LEAIDRVTEGRAWFLLSDGLDDDGIRWDNIRPVGGSVAGSLKAFFAQFDDAPPNNGAKRY